MKIIEIKDKDQYNNFITAQNHSQFLQSWEWGEFQKNTGYEIKRSGVEDQGELVFVFTLIKKHLVFGKSYFYCPRIEFRFKNEDLRIFFEIIKKIAEKENVIFLRFEPAGQLRTTNYELRTTKTINVQPVKTLILNLERSEEELLKDMHQKTRYNLRLAGKKGVKIVEVGIDRFEDFWKLMKDTKDRDGFRLHGKEYYKKMIEMNQKLGNWEIGKLMIKLYLAEYQGKIIAGNIVAFFGDTATYVHGASSNEYRNVMAPYLLQWEIIKQAKQNGYKYYDFYGIDEKKWPGVTRFKNGFGGEEINYPGTFDLIFNSFWYNVYSILRKIRRMI